MWTALESLLAETFGCFAGSLFGSKIQKCLVEQGSLVSRRRMMCSTRTEALGWRVGDRPLNRNGTEGGNGNPGGQLDVIERRQKIIK